MTDYVDSSCMDLFIVRKEKLYTGAILRILEPFSRGLVRVELAYNPFGLQRFQKIDYRKLYPLVSRRDESDPNLVLVFEHFEAYKKVSTIDTSYGFIPTLEYGHVYFDPIFRCHLFDMQKVHLLDDRVVFWSYYETYTPEGVKALTKWATQVSKDHNFPCELRAYNPISRGFTPRNVKYFLNNGWVFENGFWQNKHGNLWPPEPEPEPFVSWNKGIKRPRKKKEDGQISGSSGS